jgi:hypothetical protein
VCGITSSDGKTSVRKCLFVLTQVSQSDVTCPLFNQRFFKPSIANRKKWFSDWTNLNRIIEQDTIVNVFLNGNPYDKLPYEKFVDDTVEQAGETNETMQAMYV